MQELLVPTDALEVEVHTDRRERLHGTLFAAPLVERDAIDELAALLEDDREYLPLRLARDHGGTHETLVRKEHMVYVRLLGDGTSSAHGSSASFHESGPHCHVFLADGESLAGSLDVPVPPSQRRVIDRLNHAGRFLPLTTPNGPVFVNRAQVVQVV